MVRTENQSVFCETQLKRDRRSLRRSPAISSGGRRCGPGGGSREGGPCPQWLDWRRERAVEQSRHPRWRPRWIRGRPRRRAPRRRGHRRRARRARRRGGAHRLRAEQDAHRHRRLHERLRDRGATSACTSRTPRATRSPMPSPTCTRSMRRVLDLAAAQSDDIASRLAEVGVRVLAGRGRAHLADHGAGRDLRGERGARDRRRARRHRRHAPGHGHGSPRRRAHPHLAADLRPRRAARAARRRRLRRHRRRARPGLPRSGLAGRPGLVARPGAARARTPTPPRSSRTSSPSAAWRCSDRSRMASSSAPPTASSCASRTAARSTGSHALLAVGSVPQTRGIGLEEVGVELDGSGPRRRRPRLAHLGARHLCRRRLHRGAPPGVGRGHAGTHRDVARAR